MQKSFILGWEEWVALPDLGLPAIKAKVDTGARTSALHAHLIEPFGPAASPRVRFVVHPVPGREDIEITCSAPIVGMRDVTSSNGDRENRFVILTHVRIGGRDWPIEMTLTNRESMNYRMLLGRQAIREDIFVDPTSSFRQPRLSYALYQRLPRHDPVRRALRIGILTSRPEAPSTRRLAAAAAQRGHVLELIELRAVSLVFDGGAPGMSVEGQAMPHYDAIIGRVGERSGPFAAAVIRQLEMMGSYTLNSADALERIRTPVGVLQDLVRAGLPVTSQPIAIAAASKAGGLQPAAGEGAIYRFLTLGGRALAAMELRRGRPRPAELRRLKNERKLAVRAATALRLGLSSVDLEVCDGAARLVAISAIPALNRFESITGQPIAEPIISYVESHVRSWVRRTDAMPAEAAEGAGSS